MSAPICLRFGSSAADYQPHHSSQSEIESPCEKPKGPGTETMGRGCAAGRPGSVYRLLKLALADTAAAVIAAAGVAPVVTIIDRSIVRNANGSKILSVGLKEGFTQLLTRPHALAAGRDFRIVWFLYSGTYIASNLTELFWDRNKYLSPGGSQGGSPSHSSASSNAATSPSPTKFGSNIQPLSSGPPPHRSSFVSSMSSDLPKFIVTTLTNVTLCVRKDVIFAQMFGVRGPGTAPGLLSYMLFIIRDMCTVAAAFNAPRYVSEWLVNLRMAYGRRVAAVEEQELSGVKVTRGENGDNSEGGSQDEGESENESDKVIGVEDDEAKKNTSRLQKRCDNLAQFFCPVSVQLFSTVLHLMGLDMYNRPNASVVERVGLLRSTYGGSVMARMARIAPAFGIGGIANKDLRTKLRSFVTQ